MGYAHIDNLYKNQTILLFRECYALEKIHGTSANVAFRDGKVWFSSGGASPEAFAALFNPDALLAAFHGTGNGLGECVIYGEAYGGKEQQQSWRYGKSLRFVAFDAKVGDKWLTVPAAEGLAKSLGIEFVHYVKIPTDLASIDAERDAPSEQARRVGIEGDQRREGVVLRPLVEVTLNSGSRVCAKHKRDEERETKTVRMVDDPKKLAILARAEEIAGEWVTATRLEHVLDKLGACGPERTREVIDAMVADVDREAAGEIIMSREAARAIGKLTAAMFMQRMKNQLREVAP